MPRSNPPATKLFQLLLQLGRGRLSPRWLVLLIVALASYAILLPYLERSLGWNLPGLTDLTADFSSDSSSSPPSDFFPTPSASPAPSPASEEAPAPQDPIEQILHFGGHQTYVSPAGLHYLRGSQQGHRLKHLMRHAQDEPDRPGQHGVFDQPTPTEIVALVDQAYLQAKTGKNTNTEHERQRTIYTVHLSHRIGYVGGQSGKRQNHPPANYLRLVVDGNKFITAFPYRP